MMNENKKYVIRGMFLALTLIILNKFFHMTYREYSQLDTGRVFIATAFGIANLLFLKTKQVSHFLITGFVGLGALITFEFFATLVLGLTLPSEVHPLLIYVIGCMGSIVGTVIALILILAKIEFDIFSKQEEAAMEKNLKLKLLSYLLISAVGFSYLILPQNAGVSVPIFVVMQFACLYFISPNKKPLLIFIPIFILALNSFISANKMWQLSNFIVTMVLYSVMTLCMVDRFPIKEISSRFIFNTLENILEPLRYFGAPIKWGAEANKEYAATAKRILIGVVVTIPCIIFLLIMLSSADAVFSNDVSKLFNNILRFINLNMLFKIVCGFIVGFYLFGLIYATYQTKPQNNATIVKSINGDLIILNMLLTSILSVYTFFVVIQFRYLFAGSNNLPYGLTYTHYARRGFFELLFLTGLNIMLILITTWLTKGKTGQWARFTKALSCYLCAVTATLLVSSFYRMWLYSTDDGLTRLRFLVFGFLIFEAVGLCFTFVYIIKPKFNIIGVYLIIGLTYYLLLNIIPIDAIIAKNQIDRYFKTGDGGMAYTMTLSADAAPQIARLLNSGDIIINENARDYFANNAKHYNGLTPRWQRWNLSVASFSLCWDG